VPRAPCVVEARVCFVTRKKCVTALTLVALLTVVTERVPCVVSSAGVCDPQEVLDGTNVGCPADSRYGTGTVCRGSAGVCDPQEVVLTALTLVAPGILVTERALCSQQCGRL